MFQDIAAKAAIAASDEIYKEGFGNIKIKKICEAKGKFKNGSENKIYVAQAELNKKDVDFIVVTDKKGKVKTIAIQRDIQPSEDYIDKYFVLQRKYNGVNVSNIDASKIVQLRAKIEDLFKQELKSRETDISEEPYYIQGPIIQQDGLETRYDKRLKRFLSTNLFAKHILSLPEFQCDKISLSPGFYTVQSEAFHPVHFGTSYSLPAVCKRNSVFSFRKAVILLY
jgi:hypothetical protein